MVLQCGSAWGEAEELIRCNLETSLATAMVPTLDGKGSRKKSAFFKVARPLRGRGGKGLATKKKTVF